MYALNNSGYPRIKRYLNHKPVIFSNHKGHSKPTVNGRDGSSDHEDACTLPTQIGFKQQCKNSIEMSSMAL